MEWISYLLPLPGLFYLVLPNKRSSYGRRLTNFAIVLACIAGFISYELLTKTQEYEELLELNPGRNNDLLKIIFLVTASTYFTLTIMPLISFAGLMKALITKAVGKSE